MYHATQHTVDEYRTGEPVFAIESPFQLIEFENGHKGLALYLNDEEQFTEKYERNYHDALAGSAMRLNPKAQKVLILGGGDGLAARTIYEHNPFAQVGLAELDPVMVNICKRYPPMANLNQGALGRVIPMIGDARQTIRQLPDWSFDVVLADFPDKTIDTSDLYGEVIYGEAYRILKPGGVLSAYPGGDVGNALNHIKKNFINHRIHTTEMGADTCYIIQGVKKCIA